MVDRDFRGEVKVVVHNLGMTEIRVGVGEKVAQMILESILTPPVEVTSELSQTGRGDGGFGSTGLRMRKVTALPEEVWPPREDREESQKMRSRREDEESSGACFSWDAQSPCGWAATWQGFPEDAESGATGSEA